MTGESLSGLLERTEIPESVKELLERKFRSFQRRCWSSCVELGRVKYVRSADELDDTDAVLIRKGCTACSPSNSTAALRPTSPASSSTMNSKTLGLSSTAGMVGAEREDFLLDGRVAAVFREVTGFDERCLAFATDSGVTVEFEPFEPFELVVSTENIEASDGLFRMGVRLEREPRLMTDAIICSTMMRLKLFYPLEMFKETVVSYLLELISRTELYHI